MPAEISRGAAGSAGEDLRMSNIPFLQKMEREQETLRARARFWKGKRLFSGEGASE